MINFLTDLMRDARRQPAKRSRAHPGLEGAGSLNERQSYFYLGPDAAMTRLLDGHVLLVDPQDESVASHLIAHGYWESWISDVVRRIVGPGDRVLEIGANFGYYTVAMARRVGADGSVVAFEANPHIAALLRRTVVFNGYAGRVDVRSQAALDAPGHVRFVTSRVNAGGGHAAPAAAHLDEDQTVEVEAVRLDDVVVGDVDFIRMDAEGSEPLILKGAERLLLNPDIRICMEWDVLQMSGRASVPDLVDRLASQGFQFWRIETDSTLTLTSPAELTTLPPHDVVISRVPPLGG